jgi:hypothetical protein
MKRLTSILSIIAIALVISLSGWVLMYPSPDPKNIKYVLWKVNLYKLNVDEANGTMVGDRDRNRLVIGKTKEQLRDRFGSLLPPKDASPYLQGCYRNSDWRNRDVLFIGHSSWMVVFEGDKAITLVLVKGC